MNNHPRATDNALDQTDLAFTVSDEELEKAAVSSTWAPMLTGVATICIAEIVAAVRRSNSSSK